MAEFNYPLFNCEWVWEGAAVTVENGVITAVRACDPAECGTGFLLPGLINAHVHLWEPAHVQAMLRSGIAAASDIRRTRRLWGQEDA